MQIQAVQKGFEAFECKLNHWNGIQTIGMQIRVIRKGFEAFECKFEHFESDSKHFNSSILMQILAIR